MPTLAIRDRVKELRRVPARELLPSPRNWRRHPESQANALRGLLSELGFSGALLVREVEGAQLELIDGHLRAETVPDMLVPVLVLDVDEAEAAKLLATFDPLGTLAEADTAALESLLAEVQTDSPAVRALLDGLAGEYGLAGGHGAVAEDPGAQVDRAAELQAQWGTARGQLWEIPSQTVAGKRHRLLCGDSTDAGDVGRLCPEPVQGVFTSPPYAEQRKVQYGGVPVEHYVDWWEPVQANVRAVLRPDGSFFVNIKPHCEDGERVLYVLDLVLAMKRRWRWRYIDEFCWRKARDGYPGGWTNRFRDAFEPVYHFALNPTIKFRKWAVAHESRTAFRYSRGNKSSNSTGSGFGLNGRGLRTESGAALPSNVVDVPEVDASEAVAHAAMFPVALAAFFVQAFSDPGDVWLDPFLGSGTTLVASEQLGRVGYGMELAPQYVAVALERMKGLGLNPRLVEGG